MNQTGQRTREGLEARCRIIVEYAKWTSFSAVKFPAFPLSGGGATVYPLLADVAWSDVLNESKGPISCEEFNAWHRCQIETLCDRAKPHLSASWSANHRPEFPVGWAAKLINVYLKTAAYVGDLGRPDLRDAMHPPLDSNVQTGLTDHFRGRPDMVEKVGFGAIGHITTYEQYRTVIDGCEVAAKELGCSLFEVERFFSAPRHAAVDRDRQDADGTREPVNPAGPLDGPGRPRRPR